MDNKKNKGIVVAVVAVLLIVAVVAAILIFTKKKEAYRIIKVYEVEGEAFVNRDGVDDLEPYANMVLESGDTVRVDTGTMTLKLDEDKYIYLEQGTEICLVAEGTDSDSKTTIELKKGAITNEIQNKLSADSSYEVNTPNATMAVRGTIFRVEITYDESGVCYTKVSTLEGKVASRLVYADGTISDDEVMVERGYEVTIYQDDENTDYLTGVKPIDFSQLPEYLLDKFEDIIRQLIEELEQTEDEPSTEEKDETQDIKEPSLESDGNNQETQKKKDNETEDTKEQLTTETPTTEAPTTEMPTTEAPTTETPTTEAMEYTVTFMYNEVVFGTQTVKAGECATEPSLMPEASGSWDYDFTKPVESDLTIVWK